VSTEPFFFTWSAQREASGIEIVSGQGARFTTRDGSEWLDFSALSYQANLGHGHRGVIDALKAQCDGLLLTTPSGLFPQKTQLAQKLLALAPKGFSKVFFTLGGAEAVENAIKIARLYTGRHKLLSRYRSYHGATLGALTLSGDHRRPPLEPGLVGVTHVLDCYESRLPGGARVIEGGGSAEAIEATLRLEGSRSVAAVFLEPVPGANGVLVPPAGYWDGVRAACDTHGALMVADCVLTGFGRLGVPLGFEDFGAAIPDLITVSKGLTGGYAPLGAVLVSDAIARHFEDAVLWAGLTFYGHPLGVAAALAAIEAYEHEQLFDRAAKLGDVLGARLAELQDAMPDRIVRLRSKGLLAALELDVDGPTLAAIKARLDAAHLSVHWNDRYRTLIVSPPLVVSDAELEDGVARIREALAG
jgi:taurine--2-oxoglutarate transaminase